MIYSIGYQGGLSVPQFKKILEEKKIDILVDVRSKPYGRAFLFNRKALEAMFKELGKLYWYKGDVLGGFAPIQPAALEWLEGLNHNMGIKTETTDTGSIHFNYLLLCYEAKPQECHRHYILAKHLLTKGITVIHLSHDLKETPASELEPQLTLL